MAIYLKDIVPKKPSVAMAVESEPGWRVVLKKPLQRPPEPQDMPGEELYKLVVVPIRFWGIMVPVYSQALRRPPVNPSTVQVWDPKSETNSFLASNSLSPSDVLQPVPLGKSKKGFKDIVDILTPNETSQAGLKRIEAHYEADRVVSRLKSVKRVMES